MFLFLLGGCVDAELGDKFMFNLWGNCQPVSQGILHSSLSVWWFCFSTCLLALGVLFWFWLFYYVYHVGWYVNLLALFFFLKHIFLPKVSLFSDDMLNLLTFPLGLKVRAPSSQWEHFWTFITL